MPEIGVYEAAGLRWVMDHTRWRYVFGQPIPGPIYAFVEKYVQAVQSDYGMVKSDGLADMSQTFRDIELTDLLDMWARLFLTPYGYLGKGSVTVIPARQRWL